jgi:hypothetical protein
VRGRYRYGHRWARYRKKVSIKAIPSLIFWKKYRVKRLYRFIIEFFLRWSDSFFNLNFFSSDEAIVTLLSLKKRSDEAIQNQKIPFFKAIKRLYRFKTAKNEAMKRFKTKKSQFWSDEATLNLNFEAMKRYSRIKTKFWRNETMLFPEKLAHTMSYLKKIVKSHETVSLKCYF